MTCPHGCVDARYSSFQEIHGDQYIVISDRHVRRFTEGDQIRDKISQWLLAPDPSSNHIDAYDKLQESTGKWFVDGQQFSDWKNGPDSFILLYGIAGCGKTVLCSNIIDRVSSLCLGDSSLAFAYFYFDFNDEKKQLVRSLICSLVIQFSRRCTNVPDGLVALYYSCQEGQQQPSAKFIMKVLRDIMVGFRHTYIVLDALDECAEQNKLLSFIDEITDWRLGTLHILATSRPDRLIHGHLTSRLSDVINIQSAFVDADIRIYIRECLRSDFKLCRWPLEVKEEVEMSLMEGANGMFRWVVCQLQELRKCLTVDMIKKGLKSLPKSLDETYERILLNIDELHGDDARKVLQWLTFSARPVTLAEVAEMLAINCDDDLPLSPDRRLWDPHDVLVICSSLVTTSWSTPQLDISRVEATDIVKLAHFSVKEYLVSSRIQSGAVAQYCLLKKLADTSISRICLTYLLQFDHVNCLDPNTISSFPLTQYAAEYWLLHAKSEDGIIHDDLQNSIMKLLEPQGATLVNWVRLFNIDDPWQGQHLSLPQRSIAPPLYYASVAGLKEASQWLLLKKGANINAQGGKYGNALQAASLGGHEEVVQLLLKKGVDVDAQGGEYGSALQAASSQGHEAIVWMLLKEGADVNAQGGGYGNALQAAASGGHHMIVQILLQERANVNAQGGKYGNALHAASSGGHEATVKLLLEKGADINMQGALTRNALQAAAAGGHEVIVRMLLEKEGDANAQGRLLRNALQAASLGGHKAVVQMLLQKGVDVNEQGGEYKNALQAASSGGHEEVVNMLLERGANVNIQDAFSGHALQAASLGGHAAVVQMLLEKGADVNAQGGEYGNALQAASSGGYSIIVKMLLEKGADVNAQGGEYRNALQVAASGGHEEVVWMLLEKGADVSAYGEEYGNALYGASLGGREAVVQMLLEKGANVNVQGGWLGNALQAASSGGHKTVVQLLLDNDADIHMQGGWSGNALQAASLDGHEAVVRMLLEKGADVNAQGGEYGNALQAASSQGHESVVKLLLDNGAKVNAQGGRFRDALYGASSGGHDRVVQMLVGKGADVNVQGGWWGNALQAASSCGYKTVIHLLLENGANVNAQGGRYGNALQAAASKGHKIVVQLLLEKGADVNAQGGWLVNALQASLLGGHDSVVQLLLERGAKTNFDEDKAAQNILAEVETSVGSHADCLL